MEAEFDKEIDTLLRKAHRDGPVFVGDYASPHLDADELSAFAENAMPEKTRALHMAHLADCDRCRKILSNLLVMNAEALPAAAPPSAITIAERGLPWYRSLLLFPNLAYVMGSLVLVFAGFIGYSIFRNSGMGDTMVSQSVETENARGGPNFQTEPMFAPAANSSANAVANISPGSLAANSNAAAMPLRTPGPGGARADDDSDNFAVDGVSATDSAVNPAPPPAAAAGQPVLREAREKELAASAKDKVEDNAPAGANMQELAKSDLKLKQAPGSVNQSQSGPMRNNENQYRGQLENLERRAVAKSKLRDEESSGRKVIGARTFERKDGAWYDTNYQGRPTINVRRGTAEFNKLDGGLRSIANSLSGTVVVVWGAKAYRIQ